MIVKPLSGVLGTFLNPFIMLFNGSIKLVFGEFEGAEFKKFVRMGIIFSLIIGSYWVLRGLKATVFASLAHPYWIPIAKTVSIVFLFPVIMAYSRMLHHHSREKMLYILPTIYGFITLLFGIALYFAQAPAPIIAARVGVASWATCGLGFAFYVFVESYGSLLVALFWAFASEVTMPDSAKKGFPLVVALGQIGAIVGPTYIMSLPQQFNFTTSAVPVICTAFLTMLVIPAVQYLLSSTPKHLLTSYGHASEKEIETEPGFFEGLFLLCSKPYLLGIFFSIFAYEFIVTLFDYNFQLAAHAHLGHNHGAYNAYIGSYASYVNGVTLLCLIFGVSNVTRMLGVGAALALMPLIVGGAIFGFITLDSLGFLFWLMVGSKAINYALNGPALKQLYIPTSRASRFQAQAWIETFGSRLSKEGGSIFNYVLGGKQVARALYLNWCTYIGFSLIAAWFFTSLFLGKTHKKAIKDNSMIC